MNLLRILLSLLFIAILIFSCDYQLSQEDSAITTSSKSGVLIVESETIPDWSGPEDVSVSESSDVPPDLRSIPSTGTPSQVWYSQNGSTPLLNSYFKSSTNIKWYWAGCTTMIGINTSTKEILLLDGYVSKSASGLTNFDMFDLGKEKVERYTNFLAGILNNGQGYKIKGLLVTHGHADHMGDIPLIMYLLKKKVPTMASFPIITDYYTYTHYCSVTNLWFVYPNEHQYIKTFKELVTDLIVYRPAGGAFIPVSTVNTVLATNGSNSTLVAQVSPFGDRFSSQYQIFNIASRNYTSTNIISLGSFRATAYLMDHAYVPFVDGSYRVNAFKVWGQNYPDNVKVMFMDSTDQPSFITQTIYTDHLFLTWAPTAMWTLVDSAMGHNREYTALAVKSRIRFENAGTHYIIPMHVDDINLGTYDRTVVCSSALWSKAGYWKLIGFLKWAWVAYYEPSHPYSMSSVFLSDAQFKTRSYPAYGVFKRFWNPNPPRVDLIKLTASGQAYNASPTYYYYGPQGSSYLIRFALINKRVGLEI